MRSYLLIFLVIFAFQSYAQSPAESVGFAYGVYAGRSEVLVHAEGVFEKKNYNEIIELLDSPSLADQFVGSILCELLSEDGKITLTEKDKLKIHEIQGSQELLLFKSGCTCQTTMSLRNYFDGKNPCDFRKAMEKWKKRLAKLYY